MRTINWGMIGCGNVTEIKSGPAIYKAEHSCLYAVTNRTLSKAYDYAERHHVQVIHRSAEDLIADDNIDIVYIATPPGSHRDYAIKCAEAGKPAYIEKPMALNYAECAEIIEAFRKNGVKGYVAYYRRALERFIKVKQLIEDGSIGTPCYVNVVFSRPPYDDERTGCWRVDPAVSGGGIFMDMAVHALDALDFIFGPISGAYGVTANQAGLYEPEDMVSCCFKFESNVTGTGTWCFSAVDHLDLIEIVGSRGRLSFPCFQLEPIELVTEKGRETISVYTPPHIQQNLVQSIVDEMNGVGECPSTLESAARTARICDMIIKGTR